MWNVVFLAEFFIKFPDWNAQSAVGFIESPIDAIESLGAVKLLFEACDSCFEAGDAVGDIGLRRSCHEPLQS